MSNPLSQSKAPGIFSLGIAVLSVAVALVTARLLDIYLVAAPASLFLCAIMFSTWAGGTRAGLFSVALSLLCFKYYFAAPVYSLAIQPDEIPRTIFFLLSALFVWSLSARQRGATESLMFARDNLTKAVEELGRINEALQAENAERKRAEDALRESEQRFRDYAETASDWMWETGPDHRIIRLSEQLAAVGISPALRVGLTRWDFATDLEEEPEKWRRHIATLEAHKPFRGFVYRTAADDGSAHYIATSGKPVFDAEGRFVGYRGVGSDVTASVRAEQAEEALHRTQMELAHVARVTTLGELTASIAHEVNQPLAAIVTNGEVGLQWLDRETPDLAEVRETLGDMIRNGRRASEIIQRLRALSRKTETQKVALDINEIINEVIPLVQHEVLSHRVSLRRELAPTLPAVLGDRVQLQQVIINLIVNGIEAMATVTDRPRELAVRSQLDGSGQVLVAVQDSGVGIDPENAKQLFNAFFTTKPSGMGMGLSICRSIIEDHGGTLWASRNAGPGATFQFALPSHQEVRP